MSDEKPAQPTKVPAKRREPDVRERKAMTRAAKRYSDRAEPLAFKDQDQKRGTLSPGGKHSDAAGHLLMTLDTFGTASPEFAERGAMRVASVMRSRGQKLPDNTAMNAGLGAVSGIAPENEIEAMLAIQMTGTHEVAMEMLTRAKMADTTDQLERYGALATKLLRTFTAQTEALAKMRRGGAQKVVVEHVHIHAGGQAIVGNITQGGGGHLEDGHQPYGPADPRALAFAPVGPVLCSDTSRDPLPVARDAGEEAVPNTRRGCRKRSAEG